MITILPLFLVLVTTFVFDDNILESAYANYAKLEAACFNCSALGFKIPPLLHK